MRRLISALTAAAVTMGAMGMTVLAKDASLKDGIEMHGNKCGKVSVISDIDVDVNVRVECETPDMPRTVYYEDIISKSSPDDTLDCVLEGNEEASYIVTISVPKYRDSASFGQEQSFSFVIKDTDDITKEEVEGYSYIYTVSEGEELKEEVVSRNKKDKNNIYINSSKLIFPIADALPGDANSDGAVNVRDAALIASSLSKGTVDSLPDSADFNGDGSINVRDAAAIAKSLAGGK